MIVAVDGPAGAGKSTISRLLAGRYGWTYLDTGAMYRALTLLALEQGIDPSDAGQLEQLTRYMEVSFQPGPDGMPRVFAGCREVTEEIRSPEVNRKVSEVSAHAGVREEMVRRQRQLMSAGDMVADGRDIGTVVWPEAEVKIFLTAANSERARRRRLELEEKGHDISQEKMEKEISARDEFDSGRPVAPLVAAEDAVTVDTTDLTIDQVVGKVAEIVDSRR
ncbi:MAG: (d)CMP kinase [Thermoleophilia bacterium]|nr:(d)CMP kinase [Thermoleophilia bacterium]